MIDKPKFDELKAKALKKYFAVPKDEELRKIKLKSFLEVVIELLVVSDLEAEELITDGEISVNGNLIKDKNFTLKVNDLVRGYTGHVLNNSGYICKIV